MNEHETGVKAMQHSTRYILFWLAWGALFWTLGHPVIVSGFVVIGVGLALGEARHWRVVCGNPIEVERR